MSIPSEIATARDTKATVQTAATLDQDPSPLAQIYRDHVEFVWAALRRLGIADADVEDAAHDVFVVAHRRLGEFEGRAAVRTWLYSIALRVAANRRRKHARRDALLQRLPRSVPDDLEDLAARGQARAILEALLDRLDERKRVVFVLAELEELTVPVIADMVGENQRTIYSRLRAARAHVATLLDRLHTPRPIELDAAIVAARKRTAVPIERTRRAWTLVVAELARGTAVVPLAAGLGAWTKLAVSVGAGVAAVWIGATIVAPGDPPRSQVVATPDAPRPHTPTAAASPASFSPLASSTAPVPDAPPPIPATPRRSAPAVEPTTSPVATRSIAAELDALDRIRAAIDRSDADAALTALDRYDTTFEGGALVHEAHALRVTALCKAGRADEARAHAARANLPTPRCATSSTEPQAGR